LPEIADRQTLAKGIREAARIYAEDALRPSGNDERNEIESLHRAAARGDHTQVAKLIEALSSETHRKLTAREATPGFENAGLKFPSSQALRDPQQRDEACDVVRRFCSFGGQYIEGRKRPSGKHSTTWSPLLWAPQPISHPSKREAERRFVMHLRTVYLEATGKAAASTVNPSRPGPFARFVRVCLRLVGAPHADAIALINDLDERRRSLSCPTDEQKQQLRWEDDGGRGVVFRNQIVNSYVLEEIIIPGCELSSTKS
jgi:hypothetical protein